MAKFFTLAAAASIGLPTFSGCSAFTREAAGAGNSSIPRVPAKRVRSPCASTRNIRRLSADPTDPAETSSTLRPTPGRMA